MRPAGPNRDKTFRRILHSSPLDDVFLTRLFSAFDTNPTTKGVNFKEFIEGLSVFMKGTPDEKLELSFKLYDIDHAGYITRPGLERAMTQLHSVVAGSSQDETHQIQELVKRIFDDLDVNNDGKLSLEEYKLNSMKEPLIIDFLGQFLADQTDSGSNSICSALSVPPSPRSNSSPPSPRFGHFAPPSPRLRDSLYGTVGTAAGVSGHVLQTSSPAGSFRLSNSHSLLWLNGGINGSGDLLGKVNEFEGLVAEEQKLEQDRKAGVTPRKTAAQVAADIEKSLPAANAKVPAEKKVQEKEASVDIVVVPSEEPVPKETKSQKIEASVEEQKPVEMVSEETAEQTSQINGHATAVASSPETPASVEEQPVAANKKEVDKPVANGTEVKAITVEETTQSLDIVQH
ncbi:hypothetical protein BGZ93_004589 [Podila epicladia]|nr:hypothetical protein BGZ92_007456 [Podila epicladia]KAG0096402.1 hypothetical protein BGZ93_004589 [Podila epicladia]